MKYAIYNTEIEAITKRDNINSQYAGIVWDSQTTNYCNPILLDDGCWALPIASGYENMFTLIEQQNAKELTIDDIGARISTGYDDAVELQLQKRRFGQKLVAEVMAETNVEGILQSNPAMGYQLMGMTEQLFKALDAGWLLMAVGIIRQIPTLALNVIITEELLLNYRNKIHLFLNLPLVENYSD